MFRVPLQENALAGAVAGGGDFNGDLVADVIVGSPEFDGVVGAASGAVSALSGVDGTVLWTVEGENALDGFGRSVLVVGDLSADGIDDVLVGAPDFGRLSGSFLGQAYLLSGVDGAILHVFEAEGVGEHGDNFGYALASLGDQDGDGFEDFAISAPCYEGAMGPFSGKVTFYSGDTLSELGSLEGMTAFEFFGSALGSLDDIDTDGKSEILIGAPRFEGTVGRLSGRVDVYSSVDYSRVWFQEGTFSTGLFGGSVCGVADLNEDGIADVIAGASQNDSSAGPNAGYVSVHDGLTGDVIRIHEGIQQDGLLGFSVGDVGDFDGDGQGDYMASAYGVGDDFLAGWGRGRVRVYSGRSGIPIYEFDGQSPDELTGFAIAPLEDLDGDGLGELVIGAPGADLGLGAGQGQVLVVRSRPCLIEFEGLGVGHPGTGDLVPELSGLGSSCDPTSTTIEIENGLGGALCYVFLGIQATDLFPFFGGHFYVDSSASYWTVALILGGADGVAGEGALSLGGVSFHPFRGFELILQTLIADPGASEGVALTNGLWLRVQD